MKKKARSSKSKKSNRASQRPPTVTAVAKAAVAKTDSTPPSAPTLAAMEIAPRVLDPDEISIPPVIPAPVDLDDNFFSAPRVVALAADRTHLAEDDEPEPLSQKMTPRVRARRERFSKYVKGTVAVAAAVCAMAMIRTSIGGAHKDSDPTPVAAAEPAAVPMPMPVAAPEPPKAAEPARVPVDVPPPPVAAEVAPPVEAKPDSKVETHAAEVQKAPPAEVKPVETSTKTALEEKRTSRTMLERGKLAAAIESGERAVALDATDGEAWLILGAAYQEKGRTADARKAFTSCLKEGKKGPIGECRAMLR